MRNTRKVWIIQRPKFEDNFDHDAIDALGEASYMLPAAPNMMDAERIEADTQKMAQIIRDAAPTDIFVSLGGSPISQIMFGAACALAGSPTIQFGLYSRAQDGDGRRGNGQRGSYRIIPVSLSQIAHPAH